MLQKVSMHEDWNPGPFAQQMLTLPIDYKGLSADMQAGTRSAYNHEWIED